jgi:hypothetical protein
MDWRELMSGRPESVEEEGTAVSVDGERKPAGWYPDPQRAETQRAETQRYWDGEQWGERWNEPEPRVKPTGKANRLAVTALICASLAPLLVGGILATVFGLVALDEIEESEGKERGAGMAKWAVGLGFLNIVLSSAVIVLVVLALTAD